MSWEDRRVDKLDGLDPSIVTALKAAGIPSAGTIVDEYGSQAPEEPNLTALARRIGGTETATAKVLARVFQEAAGWLTQNWLGRHWVDLAVMSAGMLLVIGVLWLPVYQRITGTAQVGTPQVSAVRELPAGALVNAGDLRVTGASRDVAQGVLAVLAGGYASRAIPAGGVITQGMLGAPLPPGRLLTLPVQHMPALGKRKLPLAVEMVLSSRQSAPGGAIFRVLLLEATPTSQPTTITVRLPAKDLAEAAKWIGSSDVSVAFPDP